MSFRDTVTHTRDIVTYMCDPHRVQAYITHLAWALIVMCVSIAPFAGISYLLTLTSESLLSGAQINPVYLYGVIYGSSSIIYLVCIVITLLILSSPSPIRTSFPHLIKKGGWMILIGLLVVLATVSALIFIFGYMIYSTQGETNLPARISDLYAHQLRSLSFALLPVIAYCGYHRAYYIYRLHGALSPEDHVELRDRQNYSKLYDWQWTRLVKCGQWLIGKRTYTPSYGIITLIVVMVPLSGIGIWSASLTHNIFLQALCCSFFMCASVIIAATCAKIYDRYRTWSLKKPRLDYVM